MTDARTDPDPIDAGTGGATHVDSAAGWLVVAATFLSTFTVFGVAYSFGAFFESMTDEFGSQRSAIALFFSLTTFLYFGLGVFTGRIADRYGPRPVLLVGGAVMVLGLWLTSKVDSLWLGYLTYGLGVGIGVACAYVPMVATVGLWFERRRTAALGVAVAGIGVGTLVVVPIAEWSIGRWGWRSTYVSMAVGTAVLLAVAAIGARRPDGVEGGPEVIPLSESIGRSRAFAMLYLAGLLVVLSLFIPFVFLGDYMTEKGVEGSAGLLVGLIGLASVLGRLGLGALAGRFSPSRLYQLSFFGISVSFLIWLAAGSSYAVLVLFVIVLGISYGGFIALSPAVAANLFGSVGLGGVLGALYTSAGLGGLIGPPLAGEMIDRVGYSWTLAAASGAAFLACMVLFAVSADDL